MVNKDLHHTYPHHTAGFSYAPAFLRSTKSKPTQCGVSPGGKAGDGQRERVADLSTVKFSAAGSDATIMLSASTAGAADGALEGAVAATLEASPSIAFVVGLRVRLPKVVSALPSSQAPAPSPADECGAAAAMLRGETWPPAAGKWRPWEATPAAALVRAGAEAYPAEASFAFCVESGAVPHPCVSKLPWPS